MSILCKSAKNFVRKGRKKTDFQLAPLILCLLPSACDSYARPCDPGEPSSIIDENLPPQSRRSNLTFELTSQDTSVATWLAFSLVDNNDPPVVAHVAVLSKEGFLLERHALPLFPDLPIKEIPHNLGFCFTSLGFVLRWTERTTVSTLGEPPRIRTSLRLQRLSKDGHAEPPFAPVNMDCVNCTVWLNGTCHGGSATILFTAWPEDIGETLPLRALSWDLEKDSLTSGPIDWLNTPTFRSPPPTIRSEGDALLLFEDKRAWIVDSEVNMLGGPIPLPVPINRSVHWSSDNFESTVVWSTGGLVIDQVQAPNEVFLRRFDGHGRAMMGIRRLGTSEQVLSMAREGEEIGVVLRDRGQESFAWANEMGTRMGGDIPLGPAWAGAGSGIGSLEMLHALGEGNFLRLVGTPGRIQRREILCAP